MAILSIQSHVVYGYVGNKAATYPLQSMGYDVWPVNTVQFSNHTGYGKFQGDIFSREHIKNIITGLENIGVVNQCQAILSGYMGSEDTCLEVMETVKKFKAQNSKIIYLCDPVMGNNNCFVKPEVVDFFKKQLSADIITPNQFEAEMLSGLAIKTIADLKKIASYFHNLGISIIVITGIQGLAETNHGLGIFVSNGREQHLIKTQEYQFKTPPNGMGDLFSAVFLGSYLNNNNALEATKNAAYYMDLVVKNTHALEMRELQIISTRYDNTIKRTIESIDITNIG